MPPKSATTGLPSFVSRTRPSKVTVPPAAGLARPWASAAPGEYGSSHFLLLPYLEQQNLYKQANGVAYAIRTSPVLVFTCPMDTTVINGVFTNDAGTDTCA